MLFFTKNLIKVTALFLCFLSFQLQSQITISGVLTDIAGEPLEGIEIAATAIGNTFTNSSGYYEFSVPEGYSGEIIPISPNDYGNGITMTDILLIRSHILFINPIENPYKIIAMDMNGSGSITTFDWVMLGQFLTGVSDGVFPQGIPSWKFVNGNSPYPDPPSPLNVLPPEPMIIENLDEDFTLNIIGIKMGDVDCTAIGGFATITGKVYFDENENCEDDESGVELTGWNLELQGATNVAQVLSQDGTFIIVAPEGDYTLNIIPPNGYWQLCETEIPVTIGDEPVDISIGAKPIIDCPFMEVGLSSPFLRRCFESNYFIDYCNSGTVLAEDATVTVIFDDFLEVISTSATPSNIDGNIYTFDLGDIGVGECGTISVVILVSCDAELGQTHCTEALVTPDEWCYPTSPLYSGADLEVIETCENEEVIFTIQNVGEDMVEPVEYIIIEDLLVKNSGELKLNSGESTVMQEENFGTTCRIEVEQIANHPLGHQLIAFVEGCGTHPDGSISLGMVTQFPFDGDKPFTDIDCQENIGAYDPNDIQGFPKGHGEEHIIEKGQKLEYLIRFQNTGTDTAFNIRVENPLSAELDWATFRPLVASHDYEHYIENGKLNFLFADIELPDSNINEAASHGFIRYEIEQHPNLEIGDVIENQAGIYFDFNEPIWTNTAWHTLGEDLFTVETVSFDLEYASINYFPNPVSENLTFEIDTDYLKIGEIQIFDALGRLVKTKQFDEKTFQINLKSFNGGLYFFNITVNEQKAFSGKLMKE